VSKITRKKRTTEEKQEIVKLIKTTDLSDRKIAEKLLKEKGIDCHYTTIFRIRKNLPKIEKEIEEEEESKSVVQDDTESDHLSTKDKDLSPIAKDLIRQKDKEIERLKRERSNLEDLRSLDPKLKHMDKYTIEQLIYKDFSNEQINFLLGTLEGEKDARLAFLKMCSKSIELFEIIAICDLKPRDEIHTLKTQKTSLDFGEKPINEFLNEIKEKEKLSDLTIDYLCNLAKLRHAHTSTEFFIELCKNIEEINNNCMSYAQRIEELTTTNKAKDQTIEELTSKPKQVTLI